MPDTNRTQFSTVKQGDNQPYLPKLVGEKLSHEVLHKHEMQ